MNAVEGVLHLIMIPVFQGQLGEWTARGPCRLFRSVCVCVGFLCRISEAVCMVLYAAVWRWSCFYLPPLGLAAMSAIKDNVLTGPTLLDKKRKKEGNSSCANASISSASSSESMSSESMSSRHSWVRAYRLNI